MSAVLSFRQTVSLVFLSLVLCITRKILRELHTLSVQIHDPLLSRENEHSFVVKRVTKYNCVLFLSRNKWSILWSQHGIARTSHQSHSQRSQSKMEFHCKCFLLFIWNGIILTSTKILCHFLVRAQFHHSISFVDWNLLQRVRLPKN